MPISSKNPQLKEYEEIYEFLEDFYEGEQAVVKKASKYVPALSGQNTTKFKAYVKRGMFYNAFAKTIDALIGSAFNVAPAINLPEKLEYLRSDATGKGTSLTELAVVLCVEALKTGRSGLLTDMPTEGGSPYLIHYDCDDITNWSDGLYIVLEDCNLVPKADDPYEFTEVEGFRELVLIEGHYVVRVWRPNKNKSKQKLEPFVITETYVPEKFGKPLDYIPFVFIGPNGLDSDIGRPPLLDLANVQHKHFVRSCGVANALHVSCHPTPYVTGLTPDENGYELKMGSDTAIILPEAQSKVGFLEFTGQGLDPVMNDLDKLEQTMAALGARVAESRQNKTLIETATGSKIREALSVSTLGSIIATVEAALNKQLKIAAEWEGADPNEVSVVLNKEIVSANMDANLITALLSAVQAGRISEETFYKNLSDAGLTEPGVAWKDEIERIKNNENIVVSMKGAFIKPDGFELASEPKSAASATES